jgi:hypothetical protein
MLIIWYHYFPHSPLQHSLDVIVCRSHARTARRAILFLACVSLVDPTARHRCQELPKPRPSRFKTRNTHRLYPRTGSLAQSPCDARGWGGGQPPPATLLQYFRSFSHDGFNRAPVTINMPDNMCTLLSSQPGTIVALSRFYSTPCWVFPSGLS